MKKSDETSSGKAASKGNGDKAYEKSKFSEQGECPSSHRTGARSLGRGSVLPRALARHPCGI